MASSVNFTKYLKKKLSLVIQKLFQRTEKEGTLPILWGQCNLDISTQQSHYMKGKLQAISFINVYAKYPTELKIKWHDQVTIKWHDQVAFIPSMQGWTNIWISINVIYYINKIKEKHKCNFNKCRKNIW